MSSLRNRDGYWHYRLWVRGQEYSGNTHLEATARNEKKAKQIAEAQRQLDAAAVAAIPQNDARTDATIPSFPAQLRYF